LYPLRRVGSKGEGRFERISWDAALDLIAERWQAIIAESGPEAILPYGYSGTMGIVNRTVGERRFLNRLGASILDRSICSEAGHHDAAFLAERTVGWEALRERAARFTPERAAAITRLPVETIRQLARLYAERRPGLIATGPGLQRHTNGGQAMRCLLALPAVTGQYGQAGGGFLYNNRYLVWDPEIVGHDAELRRGTPRTLSINQIGAALLSAEPPVK